MPVDIHEQNRSLIDRSLTEGITPQEEKSMRAHASDCAGCQEYLGSTSRVVAAMAAFALEATPDLNAKVHQSVDQLLRRMEEDRLERRNTRITSLGSLLLSFLGSSVAWELSDYLATYGRVPAGEIQAGLLLFWVLPSLVISFLLPVVPRYLVDRHVQKGWSS